MMPLAELKRRNISSNAAQRIAGKLQFFTVRIDTTDPEIEYVKLTLCAYDEDGKLQKFLVYNGLKVKRPPAHTPRD